MAMLINGVADALLNPADRGLAYGDGIYRTVELIDGQPRLWHWQWQRLQHDCAALRLDCPAEALLLAELAAASAGMARAVGKIVLTRGIGQRGYAMPGDAVPTRLVSAAPWGGYPAERYQDGVTLRWCQLRLGCQPALAGIKHLNRLENVLARSEWQDPAIHEGLLCDSSGRVLEATMSNLWLVKDGVLYTPCLDQAGVAGAVRSWLLDSAASLGLSVRETELGPADVLAADALLLSNSLIGFWPVARLEQRSWQDFTLAARLNTALQQAG